MGVLMGKDLQGVDDVTGLGMSNKGSLNSNFKRRASTSPIGSYSEQFTPKQCELLEHLFVVQPVSPSSPSRIGSATR